MSAQDPQPYVERLSPAPWVWLAGLGVAASSGLVVLTAFGPGVGLVVALFAVAVAGWALSRSSAVIAVTPDELLAGRARIPVRLLGAVREVSADQMRALRGPRADARAYLCQRGWIAAGVAVEVVDPDDPVPYWLLSSRRPGRLAAALRMSITASARRPPQGQAHSRHTS